MGEPREGQRRSDWTRVQDLGGGPRPGPDNFGNHAQWRPGGGSRQKPYEQLAARSWLDPLPLLTSSLASLPCVLCTKEDVYVDRLTDV